MSSLKHGLRDAVQQLNPDNDDDWTKAGLPDIAAVSKIYGSDVTRAEITEAVGAYERDQAREKLDVAKPVASVAEAAEMVAKAGAKIHDEDPVMLIEKFVALVAGERYRRNRVFQQISQLWRNEQGEARELQARIDERHARVIERNKPSDLDAAIADQAKAEKEAAGA